MEKDTELNGFVDEILSYARAVEVAASDASYMSGRNYSADEILKALEETERMCGMAMDAIRQAQYRVSVEAAIDRMASVSCGD